jgi:hypothetical protein
MSGGVGVNSKTVVLTSSTQTESQAYNVTVASGVVKDVSNLTTYMGANIASFSGASPVTNLVSATAIDNTTVELVFNVTVTAASAETSSYYNIPGITVSGANMYPTPGTSSPTVRLTTSSHLSSTTNGYTITVTSGSVAAATGGLTCDSPNNTTTFTGDTLPTVLTTSSLDEFTVDVTFSENVLMDTSANGALNAVNYSANGGLVLSSPQQLSNTKVRLTSGSQTLDQLYTLTVSNVWDISTPAGNTVPVTGNSRTFLGQENVKITGAARELDVQSGFDVFSVTFSKPMKFDGTTNAADKLTNWTFPSGLGTVTVCTASDDAVCPVSYTTGVDTVIYFKTSSEPALGAYTVVAASGTAANCLLPDGGTWSSSCLKSNPNDRASVDFGLPLVIGDGPVYTDPFNDSVTLSGQVVLYNGKLLIGPNDTDSGLFQTEINLSNATTIELDANNANNNPSQTNDGFNSSIVESCLFAGDTYPACANNNMLSGIDYLYTGCYSSDGSANTSLSGPACTNDGGTEYLFVLGFDTNHNANGTDTSTNKGYQSNWNTTNKTSPFIFNHIANLSSSFGRTFRAMSMVIFKGWIYQASQHQQGSYAPRWSRFLPDGTSVFNSNATGYDKSDMGGRFITRLGGAGFIKNGQHDAGMTSNWLVSIDSMYEHDDDGASGNESQLYFANGGSTDSAALTNQTRASGYMVLSGTVSATAGSRNLNGVGTSFSSQVGVGDVVCAAGQCRVIASVNSNTQIRTATGDEWSANIASGTSADSTRYYPADGGVVRSTVAYSTQANPPVNCTNATNCNTMWEDVTPTSTTWNRFMSIALPQDARAGADWDFLIPANTITPAIKAIPKMVTFNGDLYMIRNSCESVTVQTLSGSVHKTCPAYNERPQLWRLPQRKPLGNLSAMARHL